MSPPSIDLFHTWIPAKKAEYRAIATVANIVTAMRSSINVNPLSSRIMMTPASYTFSKETFLFS
jgi:hypothetical protein